MNSLSTGVFSRNNEKDTISSGIFYGLLSLSLMWGLTLTAIIAYFTSKTGYIPTRASSIVLGLIFPVVGSMLAIKSDKATLSFLGYNMIVIPFGLILGPILNIYSSNIIQNAFGLTALITMFMGGLAALFPEFFASIGRALSVSIVCLFLVRMLSVFFPKFDLTIIDYFASGIFSLYIGYDMFRANHIAKTFDNAIDISVQLYLDIINLFITLLRIMGRNDD